MRVADLDGRLLDYWVARAEGMTHEHASFVIPAHAYSSEWGHGGPIIERERIDINTTVEGWEAYCDINTKMAGATALEAAMRVYVAWKFGEEVPDSAD